MALFHRSGPVSRYGTAAGTGALAVLLLVGICGSPAYTGWAGTQTDPESGVAYYLRVLAWPAWRLDADGQAGGLFAADLRAVLLVVLAVALLYLLPAAQVARVPGPVSQFFSGWAAYVLAGGSPPCWRRCSARTRRCWGRCRTPAPAPATASSPAGSSAPPASAAGRDQTGCAGLIRSARSDGHRRDRPFERAGRRPVSPSSGRGRGDAVG